MAAILNHLSLSFGARGIWSRVFLLLSIAVYSSYGGGCMFPAHWAGSWFQSGVPSLLTVNSTHIQSKGECYENDTDKYLLYDRYEDCYKCIVIHEKHPYVLQYKETYCSSKESLSSLCDMISGDAPLFSMFRKEPVPKPQTCPFHPAPFSFTYSRGSGECVNPPSRAEACTDDWRLLLRYMACPDVPATESNVEELLCLATWKEGSTRYLVGQISQVNRYNSIQSDEDTYRCFIYKGQHVDGRMTYYIAQSGDATCNGLSSPTDGSRTMTLTNSDDERGRCQFPAWSRGHRSWRALHRPLLYHYTSRNATLKITSEEGPPEEKRLVCHSILEQRDKQYVKIVAHVTKGCESGHACLRIYYRDESVLELQEGGKLYERPDDACAGDDDPPYVTLIAANLSGSRCPLSGRYSITSISQPTRRKRSQHSINGDELQTLDGRECTSPEFDSLSSNCGSPQNSIQFKGACNNAVYGCYGSWRVGGVMYVVAARRPHTPAICILYNTLHNESRSSDQRITMTVLNHGCDRKLKPGEDEMAYNLTFNGTCEQSSKYSSSARTAPSAMLLSAVTVILIDSVIAAVR